MFLTIKKRADTIRVSALFIYTIFSTNPLIIKRIFLFLHLRIKPIISAFISSSPIAIPPCRSTSSVAPIIEHMFECVNRGHTPTPIKQCPLPKLDLSFDNPIIAYFADYEPSIKRQFSTDCNAFSTSSLYLHGTSSIVILPSLI